VHKPDHILFSLLINSSSQTLKDLRAFAAVGFILLIKLADQEREHVGVLSNLFIQCGAEPVPGCIGT
jgi:hypothetical protein